MDIKCDCGGELSAVTLRSFDFTAYAGIPVTVQDAPGLRCSVCGGETLDGATINYLLAQVAMALVEQNHRLTPGESKFLRKRMRLTQAQLAVKMGVVRETVAGWECAASPISAQHDLMLRAIYASYIMQKSDTEPVFDLGEVARKVARAIGAVRQVVASSLPSPHVIDTKLHQMRKAHSRMV